MGKGKKRKKKKRGEKLPSYKTIVKREVILTELSFYLEQKNHRAYTIFREDILSKSKKKSSMFLDEIIREGYTNVPVIMKQFGEYLRDVRNNSISFGEYRENKKKGVKQRGLEKRVDTNYLGKTRKNLKKSVPNPATNLDKIKKNLEESAETLKNSFSNLDSVRKNRREIAQKLRRIEENVENVKRLLRALKRKSASPKEYKDLLEPKEEQSSVQFLTDEEYRKLYPKKKAVVFFHKSDFITLDEYIDYMRRPPISVEEVTKANWSDFLEKLSNWKGMA